MSEELLERPNSTKDLVERPNSTKEMDMTEEFEKWWHGDDTSRHPTNRYEGAMRWAYEGWVRGAAAEREACAKAAAVGAGAVT